MGDMTMSVSWGDHVEFGEGDGKLLSPEAIKRSIARWRETYGASRIFWRDSRSILKYARFFTTPGVSTRAFRSEHERVAMDELNEICSQAHAADMKVYLYLTVFDEGWGLKESFSGGFEGWQTSFTLDHPDYLEVDRSGQRVHYGVLCNSYPEARRYRLGIIKRALGDYPFDGVFLCTRSQSRPAEHADQYGFNRPVVDEYRRRYGVNILDSDFDVEAWRRLRGEALTQLLREVKTYCQSRGLALGVGVPRGNYMGPPIGNLHVDWQTWVQEGIVDDLVVDQVAIRCPSVWQKLWPRDSGYGYVQNYVDGINLPPLEDDLRETYGPLCQQHGCRLAVARQWVPYDPAANKRLLAIPGVSGIVLGTFRLDNPRVADAGVYFL